jgi:hypothetical protein
MSKNSEQKAERFKRLAEKRVRKVLDDIRIVSNLSNRGLYDYTPEQLRKVFGAMKDAITKAEARFRGEEKEEKNFEL